MKKIMKTQQALGKIRLFVKNKYEASDHNVLVFHTFGRCKKLVKWVKVLSESYGLKSEDKLVLQAAAWLHSIGYTEDTRDDADATLRISGELLRALKLNDDIIERIQKLLLVKPGYHQPLNEMEEIICDAATWYLAKKSFLNQNIQHWKEHNTRTNESISKELWDEQAIAWIRNHQYFTLAGRTLLEEKKYRNLARLRAATEEGFVQYNTETTVVAPVKESKKKARTFSDKGIDTLFRTASANNQRISAMADNKAQILITVNAIILSAVISLILRKIDQQLYLAYPTFLLIGVSLVTIVFYILAIRPHVTSGEFTREAFDNREVNILFFGNYHRMDPNAFRTAMSDLLNSNELVYNNLIDDLYGQGTSVGRKFELLRIAYNVFMFGLVISVIAFIACTLIEYKWLV
jgi:hypothetical protein